MHGREAVRHWIVPLMKTYPNNQMVKYTHDWVYFNMGTAEMVFCARTHMADLGDGVDYTATNLDSAQICRRRPLFARGGHLQPRQLRHPARKVGGGATGQALSA